ncbi:MAG: hypothetical protein HRT35_21165 [Algicola sp.]|nr:hypothetical protein [Algicola sp.]
MNKKFPLSAAKLAINAGLVSLCLASTAFAGGDHTHDKPSHDKHSHDNPAVKSATAATATAMATPLVADEKKVTAVPLVAPEKKITAADLIPDPAKKLSLEKFVKGAKRLHEYLKNAVEKAPEDAKKFLVKEKQEIERQLASPKAARQASFDKVEAQIKRLKDQKLFTANKIGMMHKHYLETEAGKAMILLQQENKKPGTPDAIKAEIAFQMGLIAQRDQVNFKAALRHFNKAVELLPKNSEYLAKLAELYTLIEDHGAAAKISKDLKQVKLAKIGQ